jgi:hypothetical protein
MVLWWFPFKFVSDIPALYSRWRVTKNRNFFNCPLFFFFYYKSKWAQILTASTWNWVILHIFLVFLWNFSFSQLITIMQIRLILKTRKIPFKALPLKLLNQIVLGWSLSGLLSKFYQTTHPPSNMVAITKNRKFFYCLLLLYCKSKGA